MRSHTMSLWVSALLLGCTSSPFPAAPAASSLALHPPRFASEAGVRGTLKYDFTESRIVVLYPGWIKAGKPSFDDTCRKAKRHLAFGRGRHQQTSFEQCGKNRARLPILISSQRLGM